MTRTMTTAVVTDYGTPGVLEIREVPVPRPRPGEALVAAVASTVNPVDVKTRTPGTVQTIPRFPATLGWDLAGIVVDAPADSPVSVGDRVIAMHPPEADGTGCWSQYITVPVERLVTAPASVDLVTAATLPLAGLTAAQALGRLALQPCERLLVTGASGSVGGIAVQLAAMQGLDVSGLVRRESTAETVRALGAHEVFTDMDAAGAFDAVFDTAGVLVPALVRPGGRLVTVSDDDIPDELAVKASSAVHNYVGHDPAGLARLVSLVDSGALILRVAETFPLSRVADAHHALEAGGLDGKVVVTM
ncbi:2-haloacrylate reductase [Corynebacterium provencense]|uniref:2-haloacrylate reductase n=1 Tax=Corynebacterium provencense TaxID=1737425 RepID=A0A2Z3YT17_9CORY|nr:NADP-dependent oxidoreductase [Corynebacterium provencense]AWT26340.1 2-haloacrylate reductase [Corynebacterium provencense]